MRESFIIYTSFYDPIKGLSDKQLGRIFRALFDYQLGNEVQVEDDIKMAFLFFKNQMDIDTKKYNDKIEANKQNGAKGGAPKGNSNARKKTTENNRNNRTVKKTTETTLNDNVNVNDNDNGIKEKIIKKEGEREIAELEKIMFNDEDHIMQFYRNNVTNENCLSPEIIQNAIYRYFRKLEDEGVIYSTLKETRSHFSRWYKLELNENKGGKYEKNRGNSKSPTFDEISAAVDFGVGLANASKNK